MTQNSTIMLPVDSKKKKKASHRQCYNIDYSSLKQNVHEMKNKTHACSVVHELQGPSWCGVMLHWVRKGPQILRNSLLHVLGLSRCSLSNWITDNISLSKCVKQGELVDFQVRSISFLATTIARCGAVCMSCDNSKVLVEQPKIAKSWFVWISLEYALESHSKIVVQ